MAKAKQQALKWLEKQHDSMVQTLLTWCQINSGSYHLEGIAQMRAALESAFAALEGEQDCIAVTPMEMVDEKGVMRQRELGQILRIKQRIAAPKQVLLCGHMDTVYSKEHPFQQCTWLDESRLRGPGVTDMKGGLIVMLYALKALEQSGLSQNLGWQVLINADEEIGSLGSAPILDQTAPDYDVGLVFESAYQKSGALAGERKGSGKFCLIVEGKAAHAGRSFDQGINAIAALSDVITAIHHLNFKRSTVTVNVGRIVGGGAVNMVPDKAIIWLDTRVQLETDQRWFLEKLKEIVRKTQLDWGIKIHLQGGFTRPPKPMDERTLNLLKIFQDIGHELSIPIEWQASGGCCDGNNLAAAGLTTVDSLGVRGANIHSDKEFIYIDSLVERAKLTTLFLLEYADGSLQL